MENGSREREGEIEPLTTMTTAITTMAPMKVLHWKIAAAKEKEPKKFKSGGTGQLELHTHTIN